MTRKTILLVDPDHNLRNLLNVIMEKEGYEVVAAPHPTEAIRLLSSGHFDLVITDAFGQREQFDFDPGFLRELRSAAGNTPIILFSTYVSDGRVRHGQFGLAAVVPKPFDIDDLVCSVKRTLGENESPTR